MALTDDGRQAILRRYVDCEITAEHAADLLAPPHAAVSEVILETTRRFGRLPDTRNAFTEGEHRRALVMLGLAPGDATAGRR